MSTSLYCPPSGHTKYITEQATPSTQQQQLQLHQQQPSKNVAASRSQMLVEDEVHGVIEIPSYIEEIVNHVLFQRLKNIKQLGLLPLIGVLEASNHTRYEHCIGTYRCAQDMLNALERNSNYEQRLPEWCRLAVEIAALLHDVGHGPFSHVWELACGGSFDHEKNGLICVDKIFGDMKSEELRSLREDKNGRGVQLIKALIIGNSELLTYPMMGQGYIFDIVHNSRNGLDVDKWDYLRRDNKRLKVLTEEEMQFDEVFLKARISPDGQCIEYRYDDFHLIYKLYVARWRLLIDAYQLPKVLAFNNMFCKVVQRCRPELLKILADSDGWLDLYDDRVLDLMDSDRLTIYLRSPERCVGKSDCVAEKADLVFVKEVKPGPGVEMDRGKVYPLYGDKRKKRIINRRMSSTEITGCFELIGESRLRNCGASSEAK